MTDKAVTLTRAGRVTRLTINRPDKRNAISRAMFAQIAAAALAFGADPDADVMILSGAGDRAFTSGADMGEFGDAFSGPEKAAQWNMLVRDAGLALDRLDKPVIAAINGHCAGGGIGLALACDFRIAVDGARFMLPPARLGVVYSDSDTARLVRTLGDRAARRLLLTGDELSAEEALSIGLVDQLVAADALAGAVESLAQSLLARSQTSIRLAKRMLRAVSPCAGGQGPDAALRADFDAAFQGADLKHVIDALARGKKPDFTRG